jgi:ABC-type uncharacterized transport system substrate-binding protein
VSLKVAVVVAATSGSALAAKAATQSIPVVFMMVATPWRMAWSRASKAI